MGEAATKEYMAQRSARKTRRVWLPILLFGACFAVLLGRLVHIQVINHDNYSVQAENTLIGKMCVARLNDASMMSTRNIEETNQRIKPRKNFNELINE